ncbi:hypothetical protein Leryth_007405 [Lithospermum erythrorhizon]|nr:hypothetical protein Leryth_007405 [Lithospermum erythrorhizon]
MVRYGAEMVFSSKDKVQLVGDEDIDRIIAKGEEATAELDAKMKKFTEDAIKFKMDDIDFKKIAGDNLVETSRRDRKRKVSQTLLWVVSSRLKELGYLVMPQLHDFQFFNTQRLTELYEKEVRLSLMTNKKNQPKRFNRNIGEPLTAGRNNMRKINYLRS